MSRDRAAVGWDARRVITNAHPARSCAPHGGRDSPGWPLTSQVIGGVALLAYSGAQGEGAAVATAELAVWQRAERATRYDSGGSSSRNFRIRP